MSSFLGKRGEARKVNPCSSEMAINQELLQGGQEGVIRFRAGLPPPQPLPYPLPPRSF